MVRVRPRWEPRLRLQGPATVQVSEQLLSGLSPVVTPLSRDDLRNRRRRRRHRRRHRRRRVQAHLVAQITDSIYLISALAPVRVAKMERALGSCLIDCMCSHRNAYIAHLAILTREVTVPYYIDLKTGPLLAQESSVIRTNFWTNIPSSVDSQKKMKPEYQPRQSACRPWAPIQVDKRWQNAEIRKTRELHSPVKDNALAPRVPEDGSDLASMRHEAAAPGLAKKERKSLGKKVILPHAGLV